MTFKPADDILEEQQNNIQPSGDAQQSVSGSENLGETVFCVDERTSNVSVKVENQLNLENAVIEESVNTDFSSFLKTEAEAESSINGDMNIQGNMKDVVEVDNKNQEIQIQSNVGEKVEEFIVKNKDEKSDSIEKKNNDEARINLVSQINGSTHSNLDLLVDQNWLSTINLYKIVNRIVFKRGSFIFVSILGLILGIIFQTQASQDKIQYIVNDSKIDKIWEPSATQSILNSIEGIDSIVPYGVAENKNGVLNSKGNLLKYKGIVLPQSISLKYDEGFFSLSAFDLGETSRKELENLLFKIVLNTSNLNTSTEMVQSIPGGLEQGFNLSCLDSVKLSNVVCNKFLDIFYKYGKYYNLVSYDTELLNIAKKLKNQGKSVQPVCDMISEFTYRSSKYSSMLESIMDMCGKEQSENYKNLVHFIDVDQSLVAMDSTPLSNSDLNAYKLVSFWQMIESKNNIDKGSIEKYLTFLEGVLDKDMGKNKYLEPIYKDLAYVYNMDYLYNPLQLNEKGSISSDDAKSLLMHINQINNGTVLGSIGLKSQLTTKDIIQTGFVVDESSVYRSARELFEPYLSRLERLQVRKVSEISDEEIKVQTEIYSMAILNVTEGETLKATVSLKNHNRVLYVEKITIAQYSDFSRMLNEYVNAQDVSFNDMLVYIDDMARFLIKDEELPQITLCDAFSGMELDLYTCDDSSLVLYKGDLEYSFVLNNWVLNDFSINNSDLETEIKEKLNGVLSTKANTESLIKSIIAYEIGDTPDLEIVDNELQLIDQFRIHFGRIPEVTIIEGEKEIFLVKFELGEFLLQARYNINTHLLTRVSYVIGEETLEIRGLTIELSAQNDQLSTIINNPKVFLSTFNPSAWKKYQKMLNGEE